VNAGAARCGAAAAFTVVPAAGRGPAADEPAACEPAADEAAADEPATYNRPVASPA